MRETALEQRQQPHRKHLPAHEANRQRGQAYLVVVLLLLCAEMGQKGLEQRRYQRDARDAVASKRIDET